eukprot:gnl/TRDRNA2_/TRDRNA2_139469_c0_seq4.p1 gnl/TRDRNA2_/TRDRNA2_139469_c0~~gnl/TRDRNA2_/TRDRNA2_139469_c0_seq4.p1  ORF type:complete len:168 (+),score=22.79 gnl/TRDRNA2_/TRDRNA2_139469_c0_seq4:409-912(+)
MLVKLVNSTGIGAGDAAISLDVADRDDADQRVKLRFEKLKQEIFSEHRVGSRDSLAELQRSSLANGSSSFAEVSNWKFFNKSWLSDLSARLGARRRNLEVDEDSAHGESSTRRSDILRMLNLDELDRWKVRRNASSGQRSRSRSRSPPPRSRLNEKQRIGVSKECPF